MAGYSFKREVFVILKGKNITIAKDNKFLELALVAEASCIISGNEDLLTLNPFRGIPIVNAKDFLNTFNFI